jgi:putative lipoprotein
LRKILIIVFVLLIFLLTTSVFADDSFRERLWTRGADEDPWLGKDKFLHFTVSAGIAFGSYYLYREELNNNETGSYYFSGGITISIGALKEFYDAKHPESQTASWKDMTADFLGMCAGLGLAYIAFE